MIDLDQYILNGPEESGIDSSNGEWSDDSSTDSTKSTEPEIKTHFNDLLKKSYAFQPFVFQIGVPESKILRARSGHRIVCNDSSVYSYGGYLNRDEENLNVHHSGLDIIRREEMIFEELLAFNFSKETWKKVVTSGDLPRGVVSHTSVLHGNHLIVFGGTALPFGDMASNSVDMCNLKTQVWTELLTSGEVPQGIYGHATVLDEANKCLYTVGGTTGHNFFIDVHKLDLASGQWECLFMSKGDFAQTGEPKPRYRHEAAFDGTFIYIIGGGTSLCYDSLASIPVFNVKTHQWSNKETIGDYKTNSHPLPRKCHALVQAGVDLWISGGENEEKLFGEFWRLHLPTMTWTLVYTGSVTELSFHSASVTPHGCMYIFGGIQHIDNDVHGTVSKDRTNRIIKMWLKIPKLKEICWEAITFYDKSVKILPAKELLAKGIPSEFVERMDTT